MTTHSIAPPAEAWWASSANDNQGSICVANAFYTTETNWLCYGVRVYMAANGLANGGSGSIDVFASPMAGSGLVIGASVLAAKTVAFAAAGWLEVLWDTPIPMVSGTPLWLGYRTAGGFYQFHSLGAPSNVRVQAADGSNLWMGVPNSGPDWSEFQYGQPTALIAAPSTASAAWGLDILAGPPASTATPDQVFAAYPLRFFGLGYAQFAPLPATTRVVRHWLLERGHAVATPSITAARAFTLNGTTYAAGADLKTLSPAVLRRLLQSRRAR